MPDQGITQGSWASGLVDGLVIERKRINRRDDCGAKLLKEQTGRNRNDKEKN